jgi:ABC-2 type transport system permease protein
MIRRVRAQAKIELLLTLRRGESLLVVAGIPVAILVFFSSVRVLPHTGRAVDFLVPGVLTLAVIASAMTNLGIATGFERHAGVLSRLGTTPLGRSGLFVAKLLALAAVVIVQAMLVVGVGKALGWRPHGNPAIAIGIVVVGTVAFAALGFLLAGTLRAETNLALANALFLAFLLLGGVTVPVSSLPDALARLARVLPAAPLAAALRAALQGRTVNTSDVIVLGIWAVIATLAGARWFRWD